MSQLGYFEYWFGLESLEHQGEYYDMWLWTDGSIPTYTNWAADRPKPGLGDCGYMFGSAQSMGTWYQAPVSTFFTGQLKVFVFEIFTTKLSDQAIKKL